MNSYILSCSFLFVITLADRDCGSEKFECTRNNPCDPLCNPGQTIYPGNWNNNWIECKDGGKCREYTCPPLTFWDQEHQQCEDENGVVARCSYGKHNCRDKNPCNPELCSEGLMFYPGDWVNNYVECREGNKCLERQCDKLYVWDQGTQECVPKEDETPTEQDCDADKFQCERNNPCDPLCTKDQYLYPGNWHNNFIECGKNGDCNEGRCPPKTYWNQDSQQCENEDGIVARCSYGTHNCDDKNPCSPSLCVDGLFFYPGKWHNKYVECKEGGKCIERECEPRYVWDQEPQKCVPKEEGPPETRCDAKVFDCEDDTNPCIPSLCKHDILYYPHHDADKFVQCHPSTHCAIRHCAEGAEWCDEYQACVYV